MSKISELSDGGVIQGGDTLIAVRSGGNVKVTYGGTTTANIDGGTIDGTTIGGTTPAAGNFTTGSFTGDVTFADNRKAIFGAGSDLQIYHSGSHSIIDEAGNGDLYLRSTNGDAVFIYAGGTTSSKKRLAAKSTGEVELYHGSTARLTTTSTGIDVTGTVTADAVATGTSTFTGNLTIDAAGASVTVKDSNDGGTVAFVFENDSGTTSSIRGASSSQDIQIKPNEVLAANFASGGDISFYEDTGTTAKLTWSASNERLILSTSGAYALDVQASGTSSATMAQFSNSNGSDKAAIRLDANGDGELVLIDAGNNEDVVITAGGDSYFNGGNVGIGTDSPSQEFHLRQSSGDCNLLIDSANGASQIFFGDDESVNIGNIRYDHASDFMRFSTNSAEAMRIDASGHLLVGKTGTGINNLGIEVRANGLFSATRDSSTVGYFTRTTDDGDIVEFRKDSTTVGSIGVGNGSSYIYIGTGDTGIMTNSGNDYIQPWNPSANSTRTDNISIGNSTNRFKDLYLSGGAYLGGTAAANKLDDYEEGTWTPTVLNYDGTMTVDSATYEKIGRQVTLRAVLSFDGTSDGSQLLLNIPFSHLSTAEGSLGVARGGGNINVIHKNASARINGRKADGTSTTYTSLANSTIEFTYIYATA